MGSFLSLNKLTDTFRHISHNPGKALGGLIKNPAGKLVGDNIRATGAYKTGFRPLIKGATGAVEGLLLSGGNPIYAGIGGLQGAFSGGFNSPFKPMKNVLGPAATTLALQGLGGTATGLSGGNPGVLDTIGSALAPGGGGNTFFGFNPGVLGQQAFQGGLKLGNTIASGFPTITSAVGGTPAPAATTTSVPAAGLYDSLPAGLGAPPGATVGDVAAGAASGAGAGAAAAEGGSTIGTVLQDLAFASGLANTLLGGDPPPDPRDLSAQQLDSIKNAETAIAQGGLAPAITQLMNNPAVQEQLAVIAQRTQETVGASLLQSYGVQSNASGAISSSGQQQLVAQISDIVARAVEQNQLAFLIQTASASTNAQLGAIGQAGQFTSTPAIDKNKQISEILLALGDRPGRTLENIFGGVFDGRTPPFNPNATVAV